MIGFLLIDKPKHVTSFLCVALLRKVLQERKIGFAGTLDPLATGLMIFAIGKATKSLQYFQNLDKVYEVVIQLGATSSTYDADGAITPFLSSVLNVQVPTVSFIQKTLKEEFFGEREQVVPAFSAVHIQGKRAYDLARKGKDFALPRRKVTFFDIQILSYEWPKLRLLVHCSSGTYIRSLVHDLGQKLGCGAYVKELRRTKIGEYLVGGSLNLEDQNIFFPKTEDFKLRNFCKDDEIFQNLRSKILPRLLLQLF